MKELPDLSRDMLDRARLNRDARLDGRFFIAISNRRTYCRPICPIVAPNDAEVRYYALAAEAAEQGYRPCLRSRPRSGTGLTSLGGNICSGAPSAAADTEYAYAIFYIALAVSLLPQFAFAGARMPSTSLLLGFIFAFITIAWPTFYATIVARAGDLLRKSTIRRTLEGVTGSVSSSGCGLRPSKSNHVV